jgi:hypothetical protein
MLSVDAQQYMGAILAHARALVAFAQILGPNRSTDRKIARAAAQCSKAPAQLRLAPQNKTASPINK